MGISINKSPTKSEWEEFNKSHKDSGHTLEVKGVPMYQWICNCGASKLLRFNSGIPLGLKIQWRRHFEEVANLKEAQGK